MPDKQVTGNSGKGKTSWNNMRKKSGKEPKEKLYILLYREKPNSINYVVRLQIHLGL